jgi:hypothetical protein
MNWEAIGAIAELAGATGVIATLAYLAVQIRQNTKAIHGATLNAITEHKQSEIRWSSSIGETYRRSIYEPEQLTSVEEFVMADWLTGSFVARENEYFQYKQGLLAQENWRSSEKAIRLILGSRWALNWWHQFSKISFSEVFVVYVNENLLDEVGDYKDRLASLRIDENEI